MSDSLEQAISSDDLRAMIRVKISEGISDQNISELISLFVPAELVRERPSSRSGRLPLELIESDRRAAFLAKLLRLQ